MNGSAAKANRRDLRRALGAEAVQTLPEHAERINQLTVSLNLAHDRIDKLEIAQTNHLDWLNRHRVRLDALEAVRERKFVDRLRWLVLGR